MAQHLLGLAAAPPSCLLMRLLLLLHLPSSHLQLARSPALNVEKAPKLFALPKSPSCSCSIIIFPSLLRLLLLLLWMLWGTFGRWWLVLSLRGVG